MTTYKEMQAQMHKRIEEFPIRFAFSEAQLEDALRELGCKRGEVVSVGAGSIIPKAALKDWIDMGTQHQAELDAAMEDYEFAYDAFKYEMGNHEYHINLQGDWDVIRCFWNTEYEDGKSGVRYLKDLGKATVTQKAYADAVRDFYRECDENDWW